MKINYSEQFKIRLANPDPSMDFHDLVKTLIVRRIKYKYRKKINHQIIETEKPIGKGIVCDIFHFDNLSKDAICYEIQKSVTLKWLKETKEKYENMKLKKEYKDEIKNLSWILVDLNILPKDVRRLGKQIDEVIV